MADDSEGLFYVALGPMAAILIGAALVPLRGYTTASNFAFVFVVLTIAVAEMGGRWAAVVTAVVSGLSLDFFLTQPYLRLTIAEKHDAIAVAGLTVCGLVAAAFGTRRGRQSGALEIAHRQLDLLHAALREKDASETAPARLARILHASRDAVPLAGAVVRDEHDGVVASAATSEAQRPVPAVVLSAGTLWIPDGGGRIALAFAGRRLGWLDVWPGGSQLSDRSRRTLADLARCVELVVAEAEPRGGRE